MFLSSHLFFNKGRFALRAVLAIMLVFITFSTTSGQESTPDILPGQDPEAPCSSGRLQIQDLASVDRSLASGVEHATKKALAWQPDARLYTLRLGCPLLTVGYQWEGDFFSESSQMFYATDTGVAEAVNDDPSTIPTLDPNGISLQEVYRTLQKAGFSDDLLLSAAGGVTIRYSTDTYPFGPDSAPRDRVYAHVAIEVSGQVTDVWVSITDGTIYRYGR